jgi:hypothetical protein
MHVGMLVLVLVLVLVAGHARWYHHSCQSASDAGGSGSSSS